MAEEITVKDILIQWLKANGYDGLVDQDCECGCRGDDLMLCAGPCDTCRPGYQGPDIEGDAEWLIYPTREAADQAKEDARWTPVVGEGAAKAVEAEKGEG